MSKNVIKLRIKKPSVKELTGIIEELNKAWMALTPWAWKQLSADQKLAKTVTARTAISRARNYLTGQLNGFVKKPMKLLEV